jgi:broad specificity phosphatase PhoE
MIAHDRDAMTCRIRIDLRPRADLTFRSALERACVAASLAGAELDTPDAARIVEDELRSHGYPNAEISLFRSVEEYRNRVANWVAWRDGHSQRAEGSRHERARVGRSDRVEQLALGE